MSAPVPVVRNTSTVPAVTMQDFLQPVKAEMRPAKRKKRRGRKVFALIVLLGIVGGVGYAARDTATVRKMFHRSPAVAPLPATPFERPNIVSAEYSVTVSAVQGGLPSNVTTKVREDYANQLGDTTVESQVGGTFTSTQELHNREALYRPGQAFGKEWSRQPRVPDVPGPFDAPELIPMINDVIDQPLRDAMNPRSSTSKKVDGIIITTLTYVLDRARVPEIAPAIFARAPWLFDVPNAPTLTVEVSYDPDGLVRHLSLSVDPPQPGTGSDATWVTSYSLDVLTLNAPVGVAIPVDVVDVPAGTP